MIKKGFTLSEVMVSFMVIGVIAAIIIPIVASKKPNANKLLFKKGYYITERIVNDMINDETLYPEEDTKAGFDNTISITFNGKPYAGASKFCELFATKVNTTGTVSCTPEKSTPANGSTNLNSGNFTTTDGITWHIPINDFSAATPVTITIDVNGTSARTNNSPNCLYVSDTVCPMPDKFQINIEKDGKMSVSGTKEVEYLRELNPSEPDRVP